MFKHSIYLLGVWMALLSACSSADQKKAKHLATIADTAKYYPVDGFIQEQIRFVELRDFLIEKTISIGSTKITQKIQKDEFVNEAKTVETTISQFTKNKQLFQETVFQDLGTESYTINYTAVDPTFPLQRIDILLSEQTNIIKRLFIREMKQLHDTLLTKQYSWVADHSFQISTSKEYAGNSHTSTTTINWNKPSGK